jgi:tripartite-type tricarboxylate transporter receptor subunit TctC
MFVDLAPALNLIRDGKVRALGVSTETRVSELPDVPPVADGVPGFEAAAWQMLVAPAGTPKATVDKLHAALKEIEALPATRQKIVSFGMVPTTSGSVPDLQAFVKSEITRWGGVVKKSGAAIN